MAKDFMLNTMKWSIFVSVFILGAIQKHKNKQTYENIESIWVSEEVQANSTVMTIVINIFIWNILLYFIRLVSVWVCVFGAYFCAFT